MSKTTAIIQARVGSRRLPGKVLLKIGGKTVIEHIVSRLRECKRIDQIVLAIPDTHENDCLVDIAQKLKCKIYRGSEDDVLSRIIMAGLEIQTDNVVRVCADSPFIQPWVIDYAIDKHIKSGADYTYTVGMPRGMNAEVCSHGALCWARLKSTVEEREHVTLYFEHYPDKFEMLKLDISNMSLDTESDYLFLKGIHKYGPS